ncbi:hypothetical protein N657DRAFT_629302 [Parathielavia appendiculata]|uniref:GIT Spa2 homology (SHD) domain-containing protein n=1 Tax=Parathielavia appendiculata TaxID=2587402 RepID=A0AAN6U8V5_9PEZI|nr:hypothetical protein N657DRAFT_629302 [Parathielavia appendiculata]
MNGRGAPLSPVSVGGSEWSYPVGDKDGPPYQNTRGQLSTPPDSAGPGKPMNGNFPPGPRSVGGPSPPPSVGRSSAGTNIYARSESGRSQSQLENQELVLSEHYSSLKRFLSATSRDGNPKPPPNKARDKLQRLTGVQFLELSTDVYDELKRRELASRRPPNAPPGTGPPDHLLPEENFHPKRNQARQKLSSLGPPRFRDLATDVFCELERRFPRFAGPDIPRVGSPMSVRGGRPSRSGTPVNGMNGYPPRDQSRRRPSEASSVRSGRGLPTPMNGSFPIPPSPSVTNGDYGRPMPKQFQSNTIVPNKSTMVEEDDDSISPTSPDPNAAGAYRDRNSKRSAGQSEILQSDKKLIEDYEQQVRELREKLDNMEDVLKKKNDELGSLLDGERSKAAAASSAKEEWDDARADLEDKLAEAQKLNDSLQREIDRMRSEHANETRQLRHDLEQAQRSSSKPMSNGAADIELERENKALRTALEEQEQVTEEVRREAQEFLREMKMISQQSVGAWERQSEMEKTIESLEAEVREWQNRYARAKTQLRNMRGSSAGLAADQDAAKYVREKGFVGDNGLVKDIHVTKFQLAIDDLLQRARRDNSERVMDAMKAVVVAVRRISKDIDGSAQNGDAVMQHQKLKSRVSSTANNLITTAKNFASSAGISPVSLLDAAASHLVAAVVDLLQVAKIRSTPADELEDDDNGTVTPLDSTGFFSPQSNGQSQISSVTSVQSSLPPPPPFQGLGPRSRTSVDSSSYSPVSSPRESLAKGGMTPNGSAANGSEGGYGGLNKALPIAPNTNGNGNGFYNTRQPDRRTEDLKIYLEDQTAVLVQTIQNLVQLVRNDADINQVTEEIHVITDVVGQVTAETQSAGGPGGAELVKRVAACRERLMEAGKRGLDIVAEGNDSKSREWRMWTQTLPPIAFEIAREVKELVQKVDQLVLDDGSADDFA